MKTVEQLTAELADMTKERDTLAGKVTKLEKAAEDHGKAVERLEAKNAELIGEKRTLQGKVKDLETAGDKNPAAAEIRARIEAEYKPQIDELKARLDKRDAEANNLAIDGALSGAFDTAKVAAPLRKAATALFRTGRKIEVADGKVLVDGKEASTAIAEWAATDEGKAFVAAPQNGGSAAPGGSGGTGGKPRSQMTRAEKGAYIAKNGHEAYAKLPA